MHTVNRFNLVDEPWIPIAGHGLASLAEVFSKTEFKALGGNPVQKIALTKLLLAICQVAATPKDDEEWAEMGADGMASKALNYLKEKKDCFWLYGERPFLQMPEISKAAIQPFGAVLPDISTGNSTILTQSQVSKEFSDADKALLLVQLMGFALSGKKTDNSVVLSPNYHGKQNDKGKPASGKAGPSVAFMGLMHNLLVGSSVLEGLWLNLICGQTFQLQKMYPQGLGPIPWEAMPIGEACEIANKMQNSYLGRLVPLSRFLLLAQNGLHYSEGIAHPSYKDGVVDPSVAVDFSGKDAKVLWCDPQKRPWRSLTSMLTFMSAEKKGFECLNMTNGIPRAKRVKSIFGIWSGGLRVSSNAGEQYCSGSDDYVESSIYLNSAILDVNWFVQLKNEMNDLDSLSKIVYGCVMNFCKDQKGDGEKQAGQASNLFWQLCESHFQDLVNVCDQKEEMQKFRKQFAQIVNKCYNIYCPQDTARQLDAWAKNKPNLGWYLRGENPKAKAEKPAKKSSSKTKLTNSTIAELQSELFKGE